MKGSTTMKRLLLSTALLFASIGVDVAPANAWRGTCSTPNMVTLAYYAGWPPKQIPRVMHVMYGESRCNTWAHNKWASGLMQVHKMHVGRFGITSRAQLYDPFTNLLVARKIWERQGWKAWQGQR